MNEARGSFSRRDWLTLSSLAAGALTVNRAKADVVQPPVSPVSVAKVVTYDGDLVAQFQLMFDQIGGIGQLVRGKTVAMKVNLSGASGTGRQVGLSAGQTH